MVLSSDTDHSARNRFDIGLKTAGAGTLKSKVKKYDSYFKNLLVVPRHLSR